ncbi:MAG TPA: LuxR C-terminal-related transcriptional regulator [Pseudolabrys sp.]|nr:LuxR C-terminal-related transcriptional regulator [Pseudolabrys sp.]
MTSTHSKMEKDQGLTRLIGEIYDAALESSRWTTVLANIAEFAGGQAAGLLSRDSISKSGNVYYQAGIDPHFVRLYSETYWKFDPVADLPDCEIERIVSIPDLVSYGQFRAGRFYREWAEPQGWVDSANAVLEKSTAGCAYLSVIRGKAGGMVDDEMRRRMHLIVPHVRRAVRTGKVIDLSQAEAATFADILDGLSPAIFLVDADAQIVHGNATGRSLLDTGDILRAIHGRLSASDPQIDQALHLMLAAASKSELESAGKGTAFPIKGRSGERYVAHVLSLTAGERRKAGAASNVVAALFVRKAELEAEPPSEVIGKTYKLTPTELRVLRAIVNVGGVRQVAGNLGVADTTVKTHLGRLFEKTGVSRQADLVKLVAGYSSVLVD